MLENTDFKTLKLEHQNQMNLKFINVLVKCFSFQKFLGDLDLVHMEVRLWERG